MLTGSVVIEIEKHLPLDDRTADGTSKIVITKDGFRSVRAEGVVICVQSIILEVLKYTEP